MTWKKQKIERLENRFKAKYWIKFQCRANSSAQLKAHFGTRYYEAAGISTYNPNGKEYKALAVFTEEDRDWCIDKLKKLKFQDISWEVNPYLK